MMRKLILILGNSHINSFRISFDKIMKDKDVSTEVVYVSTNLLKFQWGDFTNNAYLRHLQYKDRLAPDIDLRDRKIKIDLVMMGMGLLGTGILIPYGKILSIPKDDILNARKYTPTLPLLSKVLNGVESQDGTDIISEENARIKYKNFFEIQMSRIYQLRKEGRYRSINWIAEPDMTQSAGILRFGEDMIQSGLYATHRRLARNFFDQLIMKNRYEDKFILHPEQYSLPTGFVDDRFRGSKNPYDVHLSPEYFRESSLTLLDRLEPSWMKLKIIKYLVGRIWPIKSKDI
ncbi:MAG: hypothetical protein ACI9XC_002488 [Gammaproteobacteria bacterium]|jgi:hypothetical protein